LTVIAADPRHLPRDTQPTSLKVVRLFNSCLLLVLGAAVGCGDTKGGPIGTGGTGGNPLAEQSAYRLDCTIDTIALEIPIELFFELDEPYSEAGSSKLTFSAAVTFDEHAATTLIDAGVSKIDIISMEIATSVVGATPQTIETSLVAAPINDFDLEVDTDDNGVPGPHRLELESVTSASAATQGAEEVELRLGLEQVSLVLGDFHVPTDCVGPTLVGSSARFPVETSP
jgi:hypothetical protein